MTPTFCNFAKNKLWAQIEGHLIQGEEETGESQISKRQILVAVLILQDHLLGIEKGIQTEKVSNQDSAEKTVNRLTTEVQKEAEAEEIQTNHLLDLLMAQEQVKVPRAVILKAHSKEMNAQAIEKLKNQKEDSTKERHKPEMARATKQG